MTSQTSDGPLPLKPSTPSALFSDVETAEAWWMASPEEGRATILLSPESSPANTFSVGTQTLPKAGQTAERCYARGDFVVYVLRGTGSVLLDGKRHSARIGTTVAIGRGVTHVISNEGDGELEVLWLSVPVGYEQRIRAEGRRCESGEKSHPGAETLGGETPPADFFTGPESLGGLEGEKGAVRVVQPEERASYWQGLPTTGSADMILSPYNHPSNLFSIGTQTLDPGAFIPPHSHGRNEEFLFVLAGRGSCSTANGEAELLPGRALYVGRWAVHGLKAAEDSSLSVLWIFTPPGLEVVLAGLGKPRAPGDEVPEPFPPPPTIGELFADAGFQPG